LRTMGASRSQLMRAFCLLGTFIGTLGTLLGVVVGLLAAANLEAIKRGIESLTGQTILVEEIYFLSTLPTRTEASDVIVIALASIALSFLATLHPARRAAGISPAEALRYG
jgi:lipoprotein-releasing system permease protein